MKEGENPNTPITSGDSDFDAKKSDRPRTSFIPTRRYRGPSEEQQYAAAASIAGDPNTPEFFSDAMMANTQAPKPRRGHGKVIIIAIALIILLAGGGIAAWLLLSPGSPIAKKDEPDDVHVLFNKYANYLLYGREDDSKDLTAEYEHLNYYYYFDKSHTDRKDYLEKCVQKFKAFREAYIAQVTDGQPTTILDSYYDKLDLVNYLESHKLLSMYALIEKHDNNKTTIKDVINSEYANPGETSTQFTNDFIKEYRSLLLKSIGVLDMLRSKSCIGENYGIASKCLKSNDPSITNLLNRFQNLIGAHFSISNKYHDYLNGIYGGIWPIKEVVYAIKNEEGIDDGANK